MTAVRMPRKMDIIVLIFLISTPFVHSTTGVNSNHELEEEDEIPDAVKAYMTRIVSHLTEKYDSRIQELEKTNYAQKKQIRKLDTKVRAYNSLISKLEKKIETLDNKCETFRTDDESKETLKDSMQGIAKYNQEGKYDVRSTKRFRKDLGQHDSVRQTNVENRVAFFAYMSPDTQHLGASQDIVFDHAVTNIGNAYNERHGTFIAPAAGTYVFSVTLAHYQWTSSVRTWTHFVVNSTIVAKMYLHDEQSSHTVIVNLKPGDDVSVKNSVLDGSFTGNYLSMFSGFLLYEDYAVGSIVG